jgi:glycosyltransferase involved in cell wall biosynthesis
MPVYNGGPYLAPAIESILGQSYRDFELILLDDGSTDGSAAVMDRYADADGRIRLIRVPHRGYVVALNEGLELARGRFIARMDADDIALPGRFGAQVEALAARPRLAVIGSHVEEIDPDGRRLGLSLSPVGIRAVARVAESSAPVHHPAVLMRREPLESVGGYRPELEPAEDYDLWLRILDAGFEIDNLPRVLLRYRCHPSSVSSTRRARQALCALMARTASRMRRDGVPDPVAPGAIVDADCLARLPVAYRPCTTECWEAVNGPVRGAGATAVMAVVETAAEETHTGRCRRVTARFLLRAAVRLLILRRYAESWRALRRAHALDMLVVARQAAASVARKVPRTAQRVSYSVSARFDLR